MTDPVPGSDDKTVTIARVASDGATPVTDQRRRKARHLRRSPVLGGTLIFFAVCLGFLIHSPTLIGPDEPFHFDRVIAAAHGDLAVVPGALHRSKGARNAEGTFAKTQMKRNAPSWAEFPATPRDQRPSLAELGGDERPSRDATNYLTQHPPLYYGLTGALMWLLPNGDGIPADQLVFWLRAFNLLLLLPLPWLFHRSAQVLLIDRGSVGMTALCAVNAAPFAPALLPGLPRLGSTINIDNLGVLIGAALLYLCLRILRGDIGLRTAVVIGVLAVVGSLTKITVLAVVAAVPIAYLVRWVIDRRLPAPKVIAVLAVGAVASSLWWIRNQVLFGAVVPSELAWGSRYRLVTGTPRPPDKPFHPSEFWSAMRIQVPSRFWGSLGLHEPPKLPTLLLLIMSAVLLAALVTCVVVIKGRRLGLLLPWLLGFAMMLAVLANAYFHFRSYTALTGVQGRYAYPAALGLLLPIPIAIAIWLGRARRWAAAVVAGCGLLICCWALYLSAEYTWLHRGEHLTFSNIGRAFDVFSGHFAFPTAFAVVAILVALLAAIAGLAIAVTLAVGTSDPGAGNCADNDADQRPQRFLSGRRRRATAGFWEFDTSTPAPISRQSEVDRVRAT